MENSNINLSLSGGWSTSPDQDFQYGAKAESYLSHTSASSSRKWVKNEDDNEWLDSYDCLGGNFDPFEDVLLPDGLSIDPDEMFNKLEDTKSIEFSDLTEGLGLSANPFLNSESHFPAKLQTEAPSQPPTFQNYDINCAKQIKLSKNPSKILINLKKVKVIQPGNTSQAVKANSSSELFTADDCLNAINDTTTIKDPDMTLKDFLKVGCADDILDELMEIVPHTEGSHIDQLSSYICNDSDSSGSESPSSSSIDSSTFSPGPINFSDDNTDCNSIDEDVLYSLSVPSTSSRSYKSITKAKLSAQEKRTKKMEQNKKAATRYRAKKKKEEMEALGKLRKEEKKHDELTEKYKGLKQEVKLLKKIMRDLFIARGVISADAFK